MANLCFTYLCEKVLNLNCQNYAKEKYNIEDDICPPKLFAQLGHLFQNCEIQDTDNGQMNKLDYKYPRHYL